MLIRVLMIIGGGVWCAMVFAGTLWATFPSQAVVDRLAYTVQDSTDGGYALKASSASPWWVGLALHDVELVATDPRGGPSTVLLEARSVSARTSPWSVMSQRVPVWARVDMGGALVDVESGFDRSGDRPRIDLIRTSGAKVTVAAIGALLRPLGAGMSGSGTLNLDIDLNLGAEVKDHEGRIALSGRALQTMLSLPDPFGGDAPFDLGPVSVSNLDLVVEARGGKVSLKSAELRSDHANLDLQGDVTLDAFLGRSRLRGKATISQLGGSLAAFESLLSQARWDDGTFHYTIACTLDRMNASCFRPDRQRATPMPRPAGIGGVQRPGLGDARPVDSDQDAQRLREERERARQERLAERRSRIEASRADRPPPQRPTLDDEDEFDDLEEERPTRLRGPLDVAPIDLPELRDPRDVNLPPGAVRGPAGEEWE
jgi:type II secretion system protein N